jgi:transcription elongation factor Elf1
LGNSGISRQIFTCPHCGERISMLLDLSVASQRYIEDCEVCCNPIAVSYETEEGRLVSFRADLP